jgi:hypothetical protein
MFDIETSKPFMLYANCLLIDGDQRSVIVDTQIGKHYFIPNILGNIISTFKGRTISDVENHYGIESKEIIKEYFNYLYDNNLIFFTEDTSQFPSIGLSYKTPSIITNTIVDLSSTTNSKIIPKLLDGISCKAIVLRMLNYLK